MAGMQDRHRAGHFGSGGGHENEQAGVRLAVVVVLSGYFEDDSAQSAESYWPLAVNRPGARHSHLAVLNVISGYAGEVCWVIAARGPRGEFWS